MEFSWSAEPPKSHAWFPKSDDLSLLVLTFAESGGGVGKETATGVGETIGGAGELLYQLPQPRDQCHLCAAHFSHR